MRKSTDERSGRRRSERCRQKCSSSAATARNLSARRSPKRSRNESSRYTASDISRSRLRIGRATFRLGQHAQHGMEATDGTRASRRANVGNNRALRHAGVYVTALTDDFSPLAWRNLICPGIAAATSSSDLHRDCACEIRCTHACMTASKPVVRPDRSPLSGELVFPLSRQQPNRQPRRQPDVKDHTT